MKDLDNNGRTIESNQNLAKRKIRNSWNFFIPQQPQKKLSKSLQPQATAQNQSKKWLQGELTLASVSEEICRSASREKRRVV